jgi:hypothetical protein
MVGVRWENYLDTKREKESGWKAIGKGLARGGVLDEVKIVMLNRKRCQGMERATGNRDAGK